MTTKNSKPKSNGSAVTNVTNRSTLAECFITSGSMYLYTIVFSIFGLIFIIDVIPWWVKILIGIAFLAPIIIVLFQKGKTAGETAHKLKNKTILSDIHSQKIEKVNIFISFLNVAPFLLSSVLLTLIAIVSRQQWLQGFMILLFVPTTLIFSGAGILDMNIISWFSLLSVSIFAVLASAAYIIGYIIGVQLLKNRSTELVNEIRSYE